jgi:hypothetical protein
MDQAVKKIVDAIVRFEKPKKVILFDITTLPVDLLVYAASDFELWSRRISSLESVIAREGVLAYG